MVVIVITLYAVIRLLDWSSGKPLPGEKDLLFNAAVLGLVALIAVVVLLDVELAIVFSQNIREPVLQLLETIDILIMATLAAMVIAVLLVILRLERRRSTSAA